MRGQHRDDCRAYRALRPKGACPACTRATQHVSPASLGCQATAICFNVVLFTCRLLCLQAASYADDPAAGDLIIGANFDVLNFAMEDDVHTTVRHPNGAAQFSNQRSNTVCVCPPPKVTKQCPAIPGMWWHCPHAPWRP
eukprot:3270519-Prymnesium_polylepis.2